MKSCLFGILCTIPLVFIACIENSEASKPDMDKVLDVNAKKLFNTTNAFAISIAIVKNGEVYIKHFGEIDSGKNNKITDSTLFEIASVTKVFTGTLMAQAVLEGKVHLEDDIRKFLPEEYPNLEYDGEPIRIKNLLGFKSGINQMFPDLSALRTVEDDSTTFKLKRFNAAYHKEDFFEDLRNISLDTLPGTTPFYNELCPELSGFILEKIYQKPFKSIVQERLLDKIEMKNTYFVAPKGKALLNGYNQNEKLMPNFSYNIWGAGGMLKSTIADLSKFLKYHLTLENKVVLESHKNIAGSDGSWNGYLWDDINVSRHGLRCMKHGGAYGVQNMFVVYPEQDLGISVVINQSAPFTIEKLLLTVHSIADDLNDKGFPEQPKGNYGYRVEDDKIIFQYRHAKKLSTGKIKSVSVAGTFNDWNPANSAYQMRNLGEGNYQLIIPKSELERERSHEFRFVINKNSWLTIPKGIQNRTKNKKHDNLILVL